MTKVNQRALQWKKLFQSWLISPRKLWCTQDMRKLIRKSFNDSILKQLARNIRLKWKIKTDIHKPLTICDV